MKTRKGRILAGVLSAAMLVSMAPSTLYATETTTAEDSNIIASFNFDDDTDGFTGGGAKATVNGVTLSDEAVSGKAAYFDGTDDYLSVTKEDGSDLLSGKEELTVSYMRKISSSSAGNWTFYAAPSTDAQTYLSEKYIGVLEKSSSILVERYYLSGASARSASLTVSSVDTDWQMVTIVMDKSNTTVYIDGEEQDSISDMPALTTITSGSSIVQIGKANWDSGEFFNGYIDNYTIYDEAMSSKEVEALYANSALADKEKAATIDKVSANLEATILGDNEDASSVSKSLNLPSEISGISFEYTISDTSVVGTDGSILYSGTEGKDITIKAVGTMDGQQVITKTISLTVVNPLKADYNALTIANASEVKGNITLPTTGENGSSITWTSSDEDVISTKVVKNDNYADTPAGVVTRGDKDTKVTLTATLTNNGDSLTKEIEVTVKAAATQEETTDYLFAYFTGNTVAGENIYFATSQDGYNFSEINNAEYVLTSTLGEQGLRDPFIMRSHEGDKFYLLATDLSIGRDGDWTRAQTEGSQAIMVWESDDLVNWSDGRLVTITDSIDAGCTWAPEAYYDEITGEYVVFWASKTSADNYSYQRIYYSKTRDFVNFTDPEVWIDRTTTKDGSVVGASTIDTTVVAGNDGYLYRISKNEGGGTAYYTAADGTVTSEYTNKSTVYMEKSKSLFGTWTRVTSSTLESISGVEGPTSYKLCGDDADIDTWVVLLDHFGSTGYQPTVTTDIDADTVVFTSPSSSEYDLPSSPRHGTVMQLTASEYKKVMEAYGTIDTSAVPAIVEAGSTPDLPATLPVQVSSKATENVAVTWDVTADTFKEAGTVTITGTLSSINRTVSVDIEVTANQVVYFIDAGIITANEKCTSSSAYNKMKADLGDSLLNYCADQLYDEGSWGYVNDSSYSTSGLYQSTTDDIYSNGWWARSGQNCEYVLPLSSGTYKATGYFAEWWNYASNRVMNFYAQYTNDAGEVVTSDAVQVTVEYTDKKTASFEFEIEGVSNTTDVHFIAEKAGSSDPVISGLKVEKVANRDDDLLASYSFSESDVAGLTDGSAVTDESGNGNNATIKGKNASMADGALYLPGGSSSSGAAYVDIPGSIFENQDELTISIWLKNDTGSNNYAGMFFGTTTKNYGNGSGNMPVNYWLLNPASPSGYFKSVWTNSSNSSAPYNTETATSTFTTGSDWAMYTTVITADSITGYYNGKQVCTASKTLTTSDFGTGLVAAIGRSGYADMYYKGGVSNVKIYNKALSLADITADYYEGGISKDMISVDLGDTTDITENLTLPTTGSYGSTITWSSSNTDVIANDGTVTRPAVDGSYKVTLTATFALNGQKATKDYTVTVAGGSPETVFAEQMKQFDIGYTRVDSDITLPTSIAMNSTTIKWTSNSSALTATGKVTRPAAGAEDVTVTLTADVTYSKDGLTLNDTKSFDVIVRAQDYGYLMAYTATNEAKALGYSLHLAYSTDGENYTALNSNTGIAFANNAGGTKNVNPNSLGTIKLFRKPDGSYGFAAANATTSSAYIYVFDSTNLINFTNETKLAVPSKVKTVLSISYDETEEVYDIYWATSSKTYLTKTSDLKTAISTVEASYEGSTTVAATTLPEKANTDGSVLSVSKSEYDKVVNKLGVVTNTSIDDVNVSTTVGADASSVLPSTVTANYSDGSTTDWAVNWDLSNVDLSKEGTYTVNGTIQQEIYENPLVEQRADPCILLGSDGYYYFTASYPMCGGSDKNGYDKITLRRSKTIAGISDAEEVTIWDCDDCSTEFRYIWAPEIHEINGTYYIYYTSSTSSSSVWGIRPHVLRCNNADDILNPDSWETMGQMQAVSTDTTAFSNFSLDMTVFENTDGRWYAMWAQTDGFSSLWIAEIDPDQPWKCISECTKIAVPEYAWERVNENVDEGPNVLISNGTLYCTFSAAGTGVEYCIGLLTASTDSDLLDADSWTKQAYPILTSSDVEGEYGPGHNSFTVDEYGNVIFVYHARGQECYDGECAWSSAGSLYDPCRDARVKRVHWAADGSPILKMTYDEELTTTSVTATITVTAKKVVEDPTPSNGDNQQNSDSGQGTSAPKTTEQATYTASLSKSTYTYNGKAQKPSVVVTDNSGNVLDASNYDVTYPSGCKKVGKYTVTVTLKGSYSGTLTATYTIVPKSTSLKSLKAGKKKITVKWKKVTKEVTGYEIEYATKSDFSNAYTAKVTSYKKASTTIKKKLKSKKKYYVRIRTYKKVNGEKIYSAWSKSKTVKVK